MADPFEFAPLDDIDRRILQLLQRDARNATAVEIAEKIGVSDGTVRNRISKLEDRGVLKGYVPDIDYERAGYPLEIRISCTAQISHRKRLAEEALQIYGVVQVHELMTGKNNIEITAVAPTHNDLTHIAMELDDLGLTVESEELINERYVRPFNHFGVDDITGDGADRPHE